MPGWKKNIPACLQPDQEGGKTGPDRAGAAPHRARWPCACIREYVCVCLYAHVP